MSYELVLATGNEHKLKEVREILEPHDIKVYGLKDLNIHPGEIVEDGKTYAENALIKALAVSKYTMLPVLADDTGLEILAMGNKPGLYTARFAESLGGHQEAFKEIFRLIKGKDRSAKFICDIVLLNQDDKPLVFEGVVPGHIAEAVNGQGGFGYDPIFVVDELNKTYAEVPQEIKNRVSHRGQALYQLIEYLIKNKLAR